MENIKIKTYKVEALTPSKGLRYSKDENGNRVLVGVGTCKDERIVVPNGVQIVGARAFESCEAKEILLPNSIEEIQDGAFEDCPNLAYLRLPNLVDAVPAFAFSDCPDFGVLLASSQLRELGKNASLELHGHLLSFFERKRWLADGIQRRPNGTDGRFRNERPILSSGGQKHEKRLKDGE
jgi:hypothetical protein